MVDLVGRRKEHAVVTIFADVGGQDMRCAFADSIGAVVARCTRSDNLRMVDPVDRHENNVVMAVLADIAGLDMRRILANRLNAVVTAEAIAGDVDVVEIRREPAIACMTVVACIATRNVRRMFARG